MSRLANIFSLLVVAALCAAPALGASNSQRNAPSATQSSEKAPVSYFPQGTTDRFAAFYSSYLRFIGEPSLVAAAEDANIVSYRLICLHCGRPGELTVIRLSLNPEGNAAVATTPAQVDLSGVPTVGSTAKRAPTVEEAEEFLRLVDKSAFWSMPMDEPQNPDPRLRTVKLDAGWLVFEGVRKGTYHVVFRQGPEVSPFMEMVRFLAKNIAKLQDSALPRAYRPIPVQPLVDHVEVFKPAPRQ